MKRTFKAAACAVLLFAACVHEFDNPSDPDADTYTKRSEATLSVVTKGTLFAEKPVLVYGGVTSLSVEDASLVTEYSWDFNNDGVADTVLDHSDTIEIVYSKAGRYRCSITLADEAGYASSATATITVVSSEKDTVVLPIVLKIVIGIDDTVDVIVDAEKPVTVVSATGDSITVAVQANGGISLKGTLVDTLITLTDTIDTIAIAVQPNIIVQPNDTADTISIQPNDTTDTVSVQPNDTLLQPPENIYLPEFPNIPGFPQLAGGECAFFATDSALMHTTLNFYDIMWEQTKADGLEAIEFVGKLVTDILGKSILSLISGEYAKAYSNGVYQFSAGNGFTIACAFHYGAGIGSHAENDTVTANLFKLDSYISGLKATLTPPFYSFTHGPLYDLIDGDVTIDASLKVSFSVNFTKLKISFARSAVHESITLPMFIVNDSIGLPVTQRSFARMKPVYLRDFGNLFHNDSLVIDHGGTSMSSSPADLEVLYRSEAIYKKAKYLFTVEQVMDTQQTAYGDRNGKLKLSGNYATTATLGFNGYRSSIYFDGRYSSQVSDSSWFHCDRESANEFGTLFFGIVSDSIGVFDAKKYGYSFNYVPAGVALEKYRNVLR